MAKEDSLMKVARKWLAMLLALTLILSALSPTAWAVEGENGTASAVVAATESNAEEAAEAEVPVQTESPGEAEEPAETQDPGAAEKPEETPEEPEPPLAEPEETVAEEEMLPANAETSGVASGTCGDNLTWELDSAGTLTISGTGAMMDYSNTMPAPWDSNRSNITTAVIESGVTSIGDMAFRECSSLTSVMISDSVISLGAMAFSSCSSLTSVTIPDSVTSIGNSAFFCCGNLASVTIPNGMTSIGNGVFYSCDRLTNLMIPNSVTSIGNYAFYYCTGLTSISISDNVTSIGNMAFSGCRNLTGITIPGSVTSIGDGAFEACSNLLVINVATDNANYRSVDGVLFAKDAAKLIQYPAGKEGSSYSIPGSVTSIGMWAFGNCNNLTSVTIPNSVTSIGSSAFSLCTNLTDVYYSGSEEQWNAISINSDNSYLTNATIHYNSTGQEGSSVGEDEYTQTHLDFINNGEYAERMNNCWAGVISNGLDTPTGKLGEGIYDILNSASEILKFQDLSVFENPYDAIIAELILAQADMQESSFEVTFDNKLLEYASMLEKLCEKADPDWSLHESEYKTNLEKLLDDPKDMAKENPVFYELCEEVFSGYSESELNKVLDIYGKASVIKEIVDNGAKTVNWVVSCIRYNSLVDAYLASSEDFKQTLEDIEKQMGQIANMNQSPTKYTPSLDWYRIYYNQFREARQKFVEYETTDHIVELLADQYITDGLGVIAETFSSAIEKNVIQFCSEKLGIDMAGASWLYACIWAYKTGWKISEALSNNRSNIECRELARAYYYLEGAASGVVEMDANWLKFNQGYDAATKFDTSYTILRDIECAALKNYVTYL